MGVGFHSERQEPLKYVSAGCHQRILLSTLSIYATEEAQFQAFIASVLGATVVTSDEVTWQHSSNTKVQEQ
ncbi:MAG: hypothetical protein MHM6MM_004805 [Cercozoa sp. M6MM]